VAASKETNTSADLTEDVYIQAPHDSNTIAVVKRESLEVWEAMGWKEASKSKSEGVPDNNLPPTSPPAPTP
jgi:hypothetical protein